MCDVINGYGNQQTNLATQTPPEELLAKAFKDDLNVTINPQALRLFIRWRWERVQKLAHLIHEGKN